MAVSAALVLALDPSAIFIFFFTCKTCTSALAEGLVLVFSLLALAAVAAVEGAPKAKVEEEERVVGKDDADEAKNDVTPPAADDDDEDDDEMIVGGPNPIVVTPLSPAPPLLLLLLLPPVRRSVSNASMVSLSSSIRSWVLLVDWARSDLTGEIDWARSDLTGLPLLLEDDEDDDEDDDDVVAVSSSFNRLLGWYTLC